MSDRQLNLLTIAAHDPPNELRRYGMMDARTGLPLRNFLLEQSRHRCLRYLSQGMGVRQAGDAAMTMKAIEAKEGYCMQSFPAHSPTQVIDLDDSPKPEAWLCWGGG